MKGNRLVYSTDSAVNKRCPKCKEVISECTCPKETALDPRAANYSAVLRIEKKGRGGKVVTVVAGLPKATPFLKELTSKLKQRCGTGGTFVVTPNDGQIELQGDRRDALREILPTLGIRSKG